MNVNELISMEKKIVTRAIDCIFENNGRINIRIDGQELFEDFIDVRKRRELFKIIFDLDEVIVYVKFDEKDTWEWVFFVFGGEGRYAINDYSVGLALILQPALDIINSYIRKKKNST